MDSQALETTIQMQYPMARNQKGLAVLR